MRRTFKGRLTLHKVEGEADDKVPETVSAKIHIEIVEYNGKLYVDLECPSCKQCFGVPKSFFDKLLKDAEEFEKNRSNGHKRIGVV